jgi:hypothetical protein
VVARHATGAYGEGDRHLAGVRRGWRHAGRRALELTSRL